MLPGSVFFTHLPQSYTLGPVFSALSPYLFFLRLVGLVTGLLSLATLGRGGSVPLEQM